MPIGTNGPTIARMLPIMDRAYDSRLCIFDPPVATTAPQRNCKTKPPKYIQLSLYSSDDISLNRRPSFDGARHFAAGSGGWTSSTLKIMGKTDQSAPTTAMVQIRMPVPSSQVDGLTTRIRAGPRALRLNRSLIGSK